MNRLKFAIKSEIDIHFMNSEVRTFFNEFDLPTVVRERAKTILSELAFNQLKYAKRGSMLIEILTVGKRTEVRITASDKGPGIENLDLAFSDSYSTSGTLGLGLPGIKRMADQMTIKSNPGEGTVVKVALWES